MDSDTLTTIGEALAGDQGAFEMLIRTYSRAVFSHAYSVLRQREEAEDVVQETFLKAYKSLRRIREPEKFPQWLFSIARNRARDVLRKRRPLPLPEDAGEIEDPGAEKPDRHLEGEELHQRVHSALSSLPEHHRLAITLRFLDGMDCGRIEETMGLTNGALRGILGRGLGTLRKALKPAMEGS